MPGKQDKAARQRASERAAALAPKITPKQQKYLESLLIDAGYSDRKQRNAMLSQRTMREIKFIDDLTLTEAGGIIDELTQNKGTDEDSYRYDDIDEIPF